MLSIDQTTFWKDLVLMEDGKDLLVRDENGCPKGIATFGEKADEVFCPFISSNTIEAINTAFDKKSSNEIYFTTCKAMGGTI